VPDFRAHLKHVSPKQVQIESRRRSKSDPPSPKIKSKFPFNDVAKNASAPVKPARKTAHSSDYRSKLRHISPKVVKMKYRTRSNSDPSSPTKNQTIFGARKTRGRQRSASAESSKETLPKAGNTLKKKVSYNSKGKVSPALPPRNPIAVVPSLVLESKKLSSMHQKKLSEVPTIRMEKKPSTKPPRLPNAPSFQKLSSKPPPMPDGPSLQVDDRLLFLGDERSLGGEDIPDSLISGLKFQSQADLYVSPPKRPPINPVAVKKIKAKSAFLTKSKSLANAKASTPKPYVPILQDVDSKALHLSNPPSLHMDSKSVPCDDKSLALGDKKNLGGEALPVSQIGGLERESPADLYISPPKRPPINPIAVKKIKAKSAFLMQSKSHNDMKPSLPKRAVDDSFAKFQTAPASNANRPPLPKRNDSFWKIPRKRKTPIKRAPPPVPAPTPPHRHTVQAKSNLPSRVSIKSAYSEIKGSVLNRSSKKFRLGDMQRRLPPSFRNDEDTSNFPDAPKSAFKGFKYSQGNLMPGDLPSSIYDISASWLNQRLGESLRLQFQPVQQVIIRDPGPYSEHEYCYILDLIYDRDWYPRSLFVKLCSFAAVDGVMKAQFVNEVRFFKKIYPCLQINERVIPECFYAKYDEDGGILILQNLTETNFSVVSSDICMKLKDIETLMQFLANLHGEHQIGALEDLSYEPNIQECPMKFYNDVMIEHKQSHMVAMIEKFKRTFLNKREHKEFVEFFPEDIWDILEKMKKKDIYAFLAKSPISLCHGNVLHDNMFFNDKGEINICDWQNTHYGFPMYDLVQFLINQNGPYREGGYLNLGMERQIIAFCKKLVGIYFLSLSQTSGCFYNSLTECWKGFQVGTLVAFERVFSKHTLAKTSYTSDFHAQNEILVVLWLISSCKSILALTKKQKPGSQIFKSSSGIPFKNGVGLSSSMFRTL